MLQGNVLCACLRLAKHFGAFDADGKLRASFGAARFKDVASTGRAHFAAKAVDTQAMQAFGLIRSFHDDTPANGDIAVQRLYGLENAKKIARLKFHHAGKHLLYTRTEE